MNEGALETLMNISNILDTGLDMETLSVCIQLCELGVNPEAIATVIKVIRTEAAKLKSSDQSSWKGLWNGHILTFIHTKWIDWTFYQSQLGLILADVVLWNQFYMFVLLKLLAMYKDVKMHAALICSVRTHDFFTR